MLSLEHFKRFISDNPGVREIELSNWGEAFLHPDIIEMMQHAYEHDVALMCRNGSNMNAMRQPILEAMVRYQFVALTCSIDGATQETYARYRKRGTLSRALAAIDELNRLKRLWGTPFPILTWQFILFEHNKDELEEARAMAAARGMIFSLKESWDESVAPEGEVGFARVPHETTWDEVQCQQLWVSPQINPDGRMLGCCKNYWGDHGNVFEQGYEEIFNGPSMTAAREMLKGSQEASADHPCSTCDTYLRMRQRGAYIQEDTIAAWREEVAHRQRHLVVRDDIKRRMERTPPTS